MRRRLNLPVTAILAVSMGTACAQTDWPVFGHDPGAQHYSPLAQITPANVAKLKLAWKYRTAQEVTPTAATVPVNPAGGRGGGPFPRGRLSEVSPLVIGNVLYLTTPYDYAAALEADTGKEIWRWDHEKYGQAALRGPAYWPGDQRSPSMLLFGTSGGYLIALNAKTGKLVPGFAEEGILNLRRGVIEKFPGAPYGLSSPPAIYKNLVITGSATQEAPALGSPGDVRAWDLHTGKLVWTFHTIPRPGEPNSDTWEGDSWKDRSGANVWGSMTVDEQRGLVYLPLGCVTLDHEGADRPGLNLYGSTLVALDAATGKLKWYFQTTHHDLWDYDLTAPPALIDITVKGKKIPAVAEITKQALLFVLDRTTGKPVYGVEERPVPQDGFIEGEKPWPTQPFPVKPPPMARMGFTPAEIAKITPEHQKYCEGLVADNGGAHFGGPYVSFNRTATTIFFPSTIGGGLWQGVSFDPKLGYILVNSMSLGDIGHHGGGPRFWDREKQWPCNQPPWGELYAIDTRTGDVAWKVPFGSFPELEALGIHGAGTPSIGGSHPPPEAFSLPQEPWTARSGHSNPKPARNYGRPTWRPELTPYRSLTWVTTVNSTWR
jgi:quinoprotein glucose dehydrogenase